SQTRTAVAVANAVNHPTSRAVRLIMRPNLRPGLSRWKGSRRVALRLAHQLEENLHMKARIGVADGGKVIEIDVEDAEAFRREVEEAFSSDTEVYWFSDVKQRSVGVPVARIAYVEIEPADADRRVGFAPGT